MRAISVLLLLILFTSPLQASPLAELEADHWAYGALDRLMEAGFLPPTTYFSMTRYEVAMEIERALTTIQGSTKPLGRLVQKQLAETFQLQFYDSGSLDGQARDLALDLIRLQREFSDELAIFRPPPSPVDGILWEVGRLHLGPIGEQKPIALDDLSLQVTGRDDLSSPEDPGEEPFQLGTLEGDILEDYKLVDFDTASRVAAEGLQIRF
ncbi:MAG: hypothetical protein ACOYD6_04120 [Limnochordia bacterium]|jgi:hypothetical protein